MNKEVVIFLVSFLQPNKNFTFEIKEGNVEEVQVTFP